MMFHPFEIGFTGFSNTGKTTLITRLIKELENQFQVGYVKHAGCGFSLDSPGKDSDLVYKSGAQEVLLVDDEHSALFTRGPQRGRLETLTLLENDMVFIEGFKDSPHEKIAFLDEERNILTRARNIVATVGKGGDFDRDDLVGVLSFIKKYFLEKAAKIPLYGLVLGGGLSQRMGKDKAGIHYHGQPQAQVAFELLSARCDRVFLSRRADQETFGLPTLYDQFLELGPLSGILTAMQQHPQAAWFVLACDMPFVDSPTLKILQDSRNPFKFATVYSADDGLPEPLCGIYEPKSYKKFLQCLSVGYSCPRKMLMHSNTSLLKPTNPKSISNINEPPRL